MVLGFRVSEKEVICRLKIICEGRPTLETAVDVRQKYRGRSEGSNIHFLRARFKAILRCSPSKMAVTIRVPFL